MFKPAKNKKGFHLLKPLLRLCDPDWIQTSDLLLRRQLLYSAELPDLAVLNRGGKDKGNE
jgi:hypothetical protein